MSAVSHIAASYALDHAPAPPSARPTRALPRVPWDCGCKLGFFLGDHDEVWDKFFSPQGRPSLWSERLPKGWKPIESGISGAAGYYIVFEVEVMPTLEDGRAVKRLLRRMQSRGRTRSRTG